MDLVHDRTSVCVAEDRLIHLPDDIIHHILSFLDMKYAVQTSILSRRWKHAWTSMPNLILNSRLFDTRPKFSKFLKEALSHRNNRAEVSELELTFAGPTTQLFVKHIVNYAYLYNVRKLTMIWRSGMPNELPQYLFSSRTLKHLTLNDDSRSHQKHQKQSFVPKSDWDFPALETLSLSNLCFSFHGNNNINLFSKCVNLKDLVLHRLEMNMFETFNVCAPQLINLTVTDSDSFPKVFNVVAPQLKNLTASVSTDETFSSNGKPTVLPLSTEGFNSLEKVNLSFGRGDKDKRLGSQILDLFPIFRSAKLLILDVNIIERLSACLDRLSHEAGPFNNLKCLKINMMPLKQNERIATLLVQVNNYLLQNSRSARTSIVDFPQSTLLPHNVLKKRLRKLVHNDTTANKVAKLEKGKKQLNMALEKRTLEAKIQMQDQVIANQKAMFEGLKLQYDDLMSRMVECKMAELQMLVEGKSSDYDVIRSICFDMKSAMDMIPESLRMNLKAHFSSLFQGLKSLFLTRIDATQWENIAAEFGYIKDGESTPSSNIHIQSDVPAVELPAVPITPLTNVAASSSIA